MKSVLRHLALVPESVVYGPSYGFLQHLIRSSVPLDAEQTWDEVTRPLPATADWIKSNYPPALIRPALVWAKERQDHVLGIAEHYDVSNDFYELFLDKKYMFYSCADFHSDSDTLEEAQTHKADFILNLINPQPGQKILELGCGWGPMLKRILEETGDRENLFGYTLSKEQVAYNEQHNHFNVEFRNFITTDYPENTFDVIYSIGAWEHVRAKEIPQLLTKLYAALRPGGKLVKHFFCRFTDVIAAAGVASQIFFPGSTNASPSSIICRHSKRPASESSIGRCMTIAPRYEPGLTIWPRKRIERWRS